MLIWDEVPDDFRKNIQKNYVVLVEKPRGKKGSLGSDVRSEWTETRLEDITTILGDGLHGTPKYKKNGEYFFINGNNLSNGKIVINEKTKRASYEEYLKYKKELNDRTILVSINGTLGNIAFYSGEKVFLGKSACYFNLIGGVDKRFVRHVLSSKYFNDYIDTYATGTTIKNVSLKTMREFTFNLPTLPEQQQIANILSALDDKIELNRQINQTLEQMAQAIFKSWFVDFLPVKAKIKAKEELRDKNRELKILNSKFSIHNSDLFPDELAESELGEIPKGWEVSTIGAEVDVVGGGTPSTKKDEFWEVGEYHWTTPKDLSGVADKVLVDTERKITEEGLNQISSGLLPIDTVLMSSRAPVGYLALAKIPTAVNQGFIAMKFNNKVTPEYVVQWTNSVMDEIKQRASGSTFAEISKKNFRQIKILIPDEAVLKEFTKTVKGFYNKITESVSESASLSDIRDSFLPKLLSGEIDLTGTRTDREAGKHILEAGL